MTYTCKLCRLNKDEKDFPHENGKIRRYICWSCRSKREVAQRKLEMLSEFGWKCQCCGELMPQFLTLDHIKGRSNNKANMYQWLEAKKKGFPKDEYQMLCMNCNFAKGHWGVCPHQLGITPEAAVAELRRVATLTVESSFTTGKVTDAQRQALDSGRHLGPIARWGPKDEGEVAQLLGLTEEQFARFKEIIKNEKNSS
jgi:hypothetical protein